MSGVAAGKVRGKHEYHFDPEATIQLLARGDLQRVDWPDGTHRKRAVVDDDGITRWKRTSLIPVQLDDAELRSVQVLRRPGRP